MWAKEVEGIVGVMQRDGLSAGLEVLNELSRERCRELICRRCRRANLRNLLRQEDVKKLHPVPGDAAQLWVCEQNVHPIGSWVLNYSKVADEELGEEIRKRMEAWDSCHVEDSVEIDVECECFRELSVCCTGDVWKGHVCTVEVGNIRSAVVRAALRKGHKFKVEEGPETVCVEVQKGLERYIHFWLKKNWNRGGETVEEKRRKLEEWKRAVLRKLVCGLDRQPIELYPRGSSLRREIVRLQRTFAFVRIGRLMLWF